MSKFAEEIKKKFPKIQENIPIAPMTAYKIGGPADYYYEADNMDEIPNLIELCDKNKVKYYILGGGCNTIFADEGFRGVLIKLTGKNIQIEGDIVTADAGVPLGMVVAAARQHNLGGITKFTGLPGSLGGAVYGNAGAQGNEIGDFIEEVKLFDNKKGVHIEKKGYFEFTYRNSILKKTHEIVLTVKLKLPPYKKEDDISSDVLKFRAQKQPKGNVAGSFFKNPSKETPAGMLIDQAGLKGTKVGGIVVSDLHGNWLMNIENGTQKDIIELAKLIKKEVKKRFKADLEPENIIIDEYGNPVDI